MELILEKPIVEKIGKNNLKKFQVNDSQYQWQDNITIPLIYFKRDDILELRELISNLEKNKETDAAITLIENHLEMIDNPCGKIKTVEMGVTAIIGYVGTSEGYRIYVENPNNSKFYAYRVGNIQYHPPTPYERRHVSVTIIYDQFTKRVVDSINFFSEDLRGLTVIEAFDRKSIYLENHSNRKRYLDEKQVFDEIHLNIGKQYLLNGITTDDTPDNDDYNSGNNRFDSIHHRVVIDVFKEIEKRYRHSKTAEKPERVDVGLNFWKKQCNNFAGFHEKNKKEKLHKEIEIPVHSDVIIFDLKRHMRLVCHTDFLVKYEYLKDLEDSLIIPAENKNLIKNLINHSNGEFKDIVRDKSGGLLVMLTGPPGVGKTLTAEVFAEIQKKALYAVQSSQLGVEPDKIEKQLRLCFERSKRWKAILLIDEADVYVHKRTTDLKQNSVVGTFLRVLEYYSGILFMTSNRADIIDDAIISRCIVLIEYKHPTVNEQKQIWRVLSNSLECIIDDDTINKIVSEFHNFSGRDIKNILKLCKISQGSEPITIESIKEMKQFIPKFKDEPNLEKEEAK